MYINSLLTGTRARGKTGGRGGKKPCFQSKPWNSGHRFDLYLSLSAEDTYDTNVELDGRSVDLSVVDTAGNVSTPRVCHTLLGYNLTDSWKYEKQIKFYIAGSQYLFWLYVCHFFGVITLFSLAFIQPSYFPRSTPQKPFVWHPVL